jgi:hypothetical protein
MTILSRMKSAIAPSLPSALLLLLLAALVSPSALSLAAEPPGGGCTICESLEGKTFLSPHKRARARSTFTPRPLLTCNRRESGGAPQPLQPSVLPGHIVTPPLFTLYTSLLS